MLLLASCWMGLSCCLLSNAATQPSQYFVSLAGEDKPEVPFKQKLNVFSCFLLSFSADVIYSFSFVWQVPGSEAAPWRSLHYALDRVRAVRPANPGNTTSNLTNRL